MSRPSPHPTLAPWTIRREEILHDAPPFLKLTRQHVILPDGRQVRDYHQVYFPDYVTLVALTTDDRYILIEKYNHGYRRACMLFPGGIRNPDETPRRAAARELREETGYATRRWRLLGCFIPHSNYGCGRVHLFLGEGCRPVAAPDSGDLETMNLHLLPHERLRRYMRRGGNPSLSGAAAFALACQTLARPGVFETTHPRSTHA